MSIERNIDAVQSSIDDLITELIYLKDDIEKLKASESTSVIATKCKDCCWNTEKYGANYCTRLDIFGSSDNDYCSWGSNRRSDSGPVIFRKCRPLGTNLYSNEAKEVRANEESNVSPDSSCSEGRS